MNRSQTLESVKSEMCDHYCKYPHKSISSMDEGELYDIQEEYCNDCPLNRLELD